MVIYNEFQKLEIHISEMVVINANVLVKQSELRCIGIPMYHPVQNEVL